MRCEVCRSIDAAFAYEVSKGSLGVYREHHSSFARLVIAAKEGCELCSSIQKEGQFSCLPWSVKYPATCYDRQIYYCIDVTRGTIDFFQGKRRGYMSLSARFEIFIQHGMFIDTSQSEKV